MWHRSFAIIGLLLALIAPTAALAWPGAYDGMPRNLRPSTAERGVYVWREPDGLHRLVGVGRDPEPWTLELKVTTDGVLQDVDAGALEPSDSVEQDGDHTVKGKFVLFTRADGFRFRMRDAGWVEYELWENGAPISTDRIFVGADGRHPLDSRFRIYDR